jgi:hypothetical protein
VGFASLRGTKQSRLFLPIFTVRCTSDKKIKLLCYKYLRHSVPKKDLRHLRNLRSKNIGSAQCHQGLYPDFSNIFR